MKIQIFSDVHLEMYPDEGSRVEVLEKLKTDCDLLIVAGDLANNELLPWAAKWLSENYKQVIYVVGNHEYYDSSGYEVHLTLSQIKHKNFHWLHNKKITIDGITFAGGPLWYHFDIHKSEMVMIRDRIGMPKMVPDFVVIRDFSAIGDFASWVNYQNQMSVDFLSKVKADVVITHYMPTARCIHSDYEGDPCNKYFYHPILDRGMKYMPKYWIHGHTHKQIDLMCGDTHVLCNPIAYPWERKDNNETEYKILIIEVEKK